MLSNHLNLLCISFLLATSCSRTALLPECPEGLELKDNQCLCISDTACPSGMVCVDNACICRSDSCCPDGYAFSETSNACVCKSSSCCPEGFAWNQSNESCDCTSEKCCPAGHRFNFETVTCECEDTECCPNGFTFDSERKACLCSSDECCPSLADGSKTGAFTFNASTLECVCSADECCPENHKYSPQLGACVCIGDSCCPPGFRKDSTEERCVCIDNNACGPNARCESQTGNCLCNNNLGCDLGYFCNSLGFCQSIEGCQSNVDCPSGMYCDTPKRQCVAFGSCSLDEHCPLGSVCGEASKVCVPGCQTDSDCIPKMSCINGQCENFCRNNEMCPVDQFCNTVNGTCADRPGRTDCDTCLTELDCFMPNTESVCLGFVGEGQSVSRFCAPHCNAQEDCPSGYDCGGVVYTCSSDGAPCPIDSRNPSEQIICRPYQVENETGTRFFCTNTTQQVHEYFRACAPKSGFCPPIAAP